MLKNEEALLYIIAGLGNPGPEYHGTRHNAGFDVLDILADRHNIEINRNKFHSLTGEGFIGGKKVLLMKPMTYMNLSGKAVIEALNFYKPREDEFIVVYDDISLKPGRIRIRKKGSAGGHNGIKDIIRVLGTDEFQRIKTGVGSPEGNLVKHVLSRITGEDEEEYVKGLVLSADAVETVMKEGIETAMNRFNSSGSEKKKEKDTDRNKDKEKEEKAKEEKGSGNAREADHEA